MAGRWQWGPSEEEGGVHGFNVPAPYPISKPMAPPIEPAVSCVLWVGLSRPVITTTAEITNNNTAATRTASRDLCLVGFSAWPSPRFPTWLPPRLVGGFPPGEFAESSSCSMRLISFSGGVGSMTSGWQRDCPQQLQQHGLRGWPGPCFILHFPKSTEGEQPRWIETIQSQPGVDKNVSVIKGCSGMDC